MHFFNETPHAAGILRSDRDDTTMVAAVIVRERFFIRENRLERTKGDDAPTGVRTEIVDCGEYGDLLPDDVMPRRGTDVMILGDALLRDPAIATRVEVHAGPYDVALDVFGDRVWGGLLDQLVPSDPIAFDRLPIVPKSAFGGTVDEEYGPIPYHLNPSGKGFYVKQAQARGAALCNVVRSDETAKKWNDRPTPAWLGPCPPHNGLRMQEYTRVNAEREEVSLDPEGGLFDRAHPMLSGKTVEPGPMRVHGMTPSGVLSVELPPAPCEIEVTVGAKSARRPLSIEEILVDLRSAGDELDHLGVLEIAYRKTFRYKVVPFERREVRLVPSKTNVKGK